MKLSMYSGRDSKSIASDCFKTNISGLFYDHQDNYDQLLYNSRISTAHSFQSNQVWSNQREKQKYGKYKLSKDQLDHINFNNLTKRLKSVKPKKGKAKRR